MRTTQVIMKDGIECLLKKMGALETEIFISNLLKESFDYTEWQREYFKDISMDEFLEKAAQYDRDHPWEKAEAPGAKFA
ncbi:hypothetical protein AGMMS50268_19150 [Spirochaetia bacterium]|nr:hypothetical protein AGMMS50268_19150 [Spirochaetia bacterium]